MLSRVKARRLEMGLSQIAVVKQTAGILNQYRLSVIERGLKPRPDEAAVIAYVLGAPVNNLFPELGHIEKPVPIVRKPYRGGYEKTKSQS